MQRRRAGTRKNQASRQGRQVGSSSHEWKVNRQTAPVHQQLRQHPSHVRKAHPAQPSIPLSHPAQCTAPEARAILLHCCQLSARSDLPLLRAAQLVPGARQLHLVLQAGQGGQNRQGAQAGRRPSSMQRIACRSTLLCACNGVSARLPPCSMCATHVGLGLASLPAPGAPQATWPPPPAAACPQQRRPPRQQPSTPAGAEHLPTPAQRSTAWHGSSRAHIGASNHACGHTAAEFNILALLHVRMQSPPHECCSCWAAQPSSLASPHRTINRLKPASPAGASSLTLACRSRRASSSSRPSASPCSCLQRRCQAAASSCPARSSCLRLPSSSSRACRQGRQAR